MWHHIPGTSQFNSKYCCNLLQNFIMCTNYCISTRVTVGAALSEKKNGPVVTAPTGRHTVPSVSYKSLSSTVDLNERTFIQASSLGTNMIAQFISDEINVFRLQSGLFTLNQWGLRTGDQGTVQFYFQIYLVFIKYTSRNIWAFQ